jgi:cytochrome c-type biogenesis protein CcmE
VTTVDEPGTGVAPTVDTVPSRRRGRYLFAVGACVAAVVAIVVLAVVLSNNVVYFRTVSEAVAERADAGQDRFRIAGAVVTGSIEERRDGVRFELTDGDQTVTVVHSGGQPSLFKDGAPVVAEGRWGRGADAPFRSDRLLIRHGSDYEPPKVDAKGTADTKAGTKGAK